MLYVSYTAIVSLYGVRRLITGCETVMVAPVAINIHFGILTNRVHVGKAT